MATTNYTLPTLESTALFDLVTDYNALANATDAALASVAELVPTETITEMQGQISNLQTLTGSQGTQITTLQSQMTTANGNITTLQSGLETANKNIGSLQTGLQTTNANITKVNNAFVLNNTHYAGTGIHADASSDSFINVMQNSNANILNIFGRCSFSKAVSKTKIPGTDYYGIITHIRIPQITEAHLFDCSGISSVRGSAAISGTGVYAIGSDGYIYLLYSSSNTATQANTILTIFNSVKFIGTPAPFTSGE